MKAREVLPLKKALIIFTALILSMVLFLQGCHKNMKIEYRNPSDYYLCRSGETAREEFADKFGMDESIFPDSLKDSWNIKDFVMIYYNPFDPQYLGYIYIEYPNHDDYISEIERLNNYSSSDYVGIYGITGFSNYKLLAINADNYYGVIYALTDGKDSIIYVEMLFCNYYMDLDYSQYIPSKYLPDGFNAKIDNPSRKAFDHLSIEGGETK